MSGAAPNNYNRQMGLPSHGRGAKQYRAQATTTNAGQFRPETPPSYNDDYPTLQAAASLQTAPVSIPPFYNMQSARSGAHTGQNDTQVHGYAPIDPTTTNNTQSGMPSMHVAPQNPSFGGFNTEETFPLMMQRPPISNKPYSMVVPYPSTSHPSHLSQPVTIRPTTDTARSSRHPQPVAAASRATSRNNSSSTTAPEPLTAREDEVSRKVIEIILILHNNREFVSREEIEQRLFAHFRVNSWRDLRVHPSKIDALNNHSVRLKDVTFYLHIFQQIFHLCTLKDFEYYLTRFLKVEKYEDVRLGPLFKHPEVQRVFKYKPLDSDQSVPPMTTGEVIQYFIEFQKDHRRQRMIPFDEFLDKLVRIYELQSHEQLGVFHRGFPYVKQVVGIVQRDEQSHLGRMRDELEQEFIKQVDTRLNELKEELREVQGLSSFNEKKTPIAVFNYLGSIMEKYLNIVPEQPVLYAILIQLRDDKLLQCLFNMSIYLGTIDQPEVFIAELKQLYQCQQSNPETKLQEMLDLNPKISKKDRKKLNTMIQQQQKQRLQSQPANTDPGEPYSSLSTTVNPSFVSSSLASHSSRPKPPISLKQLCSDIYTLLVRYDTVLTIEQFHDIDNKLCFQHHVPSFSVFTYDEHADDDKPVDLISFLEKHQRLIDPNDELSVYEHTASSGDRTEWYSFLQQLSVLHNGNVNEEHQQQQVTMLHGHLNTEQIHLSADKLSAVEKALKHKFNESISSRKIKQLITKAKQRYRQHKSPIIRYEESLLDVHGLNRLDICPTSLNIDETQLCQLILHSPLMTDLHNWFQWLHFFQPKYGILKYFIAKHEHTFRNLCLLETSNRELFRLPTDTSLTTFEQELGSMHIRSAVAHLCALIIVEGDVAQFSFNVYRTSMIAWFRHLRSLKTLQNDQRDPMQYILDFLVLLPELIGQLRVIEELVLRPLDEVFGNDRVDGVNARTRIWNLANSRQKTKLELWGHTGSVPEWQNEHKWLGQEDSEEIANIRSENQFISQQDFNNINPVVSITTTNESPSISIPDVIPATPSTPTVRVPIDSENGLAQAAFDHIQLIRRGFGVDTHLGEDGQLVVTNLQGMVARSLDKLSTDLYSDQGHFVLELVQNADDNHYTSDCLPTLRFILSTERILVCNNEIGFQPENIAAICDVGASTKGKHKKGYAGHKGIGFKSVFMVSHKPEIHSQNYHFRFDTVNGKEQIGYIRPIWIDQCEEVLPKAEEWTTCIRLPIKKEAQRDRLQQNFADIQARLLLFLNRLRQIEIINQQETSSASDSKRVFTRIDHANGQIIELQEKNGDKPLITNYWLVMKKVISVPNDIKMKLRDVKGEIDSTTIAIAYPLSGIEESSTQLPPIQPVFAYLPLRPYGFRFVLQADFEIPATRQEIRRDNLWNSWLKSEMTSLLSSAYYQFKRLPELLSSASINSRMDSHLIPIHMIKYFLKLIPSRSELDPYFNTFVDESVKSLMGIIELPVSRTDEKGETVIDWISPSRCMIVKDSLIRKLLSQDLLLSHFNCYYVHEQLVMECDEQILLKLGCRQLDFADIAELIESSYKQDERKHPKTKSSIEQIAQWLVCLDYSLEQQRNEMNDTARENATIAKLKQLKIIPLKQESYLVSANEFDKHGISFPLDKNTRFSKQLKVVLDDVPTLDEQLLDFIEDKYPRRLDFIRRLLQKLGVKEGLNIREIYRQHILPVMSDATRWPSKSESILMAYLLCIYQYIYLPSPDSFDNDFKTLQNTMVIKTRDNTFVSLGSPGVVVHLTSTYSPRLSLDSLRLSQHKFTFISDDYHKLICADLPRYEDRNEFIPFLKRLNVNDFLQVNLISEPFIQVSQLANTQWVHLMPSLSEMIYEPFKIKDFRCEEFEKLVLPSDENQIADLELCVQLLQYLDRHHSFVSTQYAALIVLARGDKYGQGTAVKAIDSSFCLSLQKHAWIPVEGGLLYKPNEVYFLQPNSTTYAFRRYVPHLDTSKLSLHSEDFIHKILGIKQYVTHQTMFELLMKWSCNLDRESLWKLINQTDATEIIPCTLPDTFRQTCLDTIDSFYRIYLFLASNNEICLLLNRFRLWPIIFIPRDEQSGDFLSIHQIFWSDPISLLSSQDSVTDSKTRIPIGAYYGRYPALQQFFLETLNIELQPTVDDYLPLLSVVQDVNQIWQIIQTITKLATEQNKQSEIQKKCLEIAFIPSMNNQKKTMKYTDHPLYPHDIEIAELFAETLPIIKLPNFPISTELTEQFCSLFGIENLSKVIQTNVNVQNEQPSTNLADFYQCSIDLIQHFLLSEKLLSDDRSNHLSTIFSRMRFICVDRIELSYSDGMSTIKVPSTHHNTDTHIDKQTCKFYILKKFEASEMRYIDAMVDFIVEDKTSQEKLSSCIKKLLQIYQNENAEGLVKLREKITDQYEPKWTIQVEEEVKEDIPTISSRSQAPEPNTTEESKISDEMIEKIMNEPSLRPKLPPKVLDKEVTLVPNPFLPGLNTPKDPSRPQSDDSPQRDHTSSTTTSNSNEENDRVPQDSNEENHRVPQNANEKNDRVHQDSNEENHQVPHDRERKDGEHVVRERTAVEVDGDENKRESNEEHPKSRKDHTIRNFIPPNLLNPVLLPPPNFVQFEIPTLIDCKPLSSTSLSDESSVDNVIHSANNEADLITGRQGEASVFQHLRDKYPKDTIKWMNEEKESFEPYDIHRTTEDGRVEMIEVKTTRSIDQNTFPVSIGEVDCLLQYPSNYFIYRVYFTDPNKPPIATVINKVRDNLRLKHIKLSMLIPPTVND